MSLLLCCAVVIVDWIQEIKIVAKLILEFRETSTENSSYLSVSDVT